MVDDSAWVLKQLAIWPLAAVGVIVLLGLFGHELKAAILGTVAAMKRSKMRLAQVSAAAKHRMVKKK